MKVLFWISQIRDFSRRVLDLFFDDWHGQALVFIISIVFIGLAGSIVNSTDNPLWHNIFLAVGCSVLASALVVRVLKERNNLPNVRESGVCFVGDRSYFDRAIGWDNWINQTSRGGEIIIVGKKNENWVKLSCEALIKAVDRDIPIRFVFTGSSEEIEKNVVVFRDNIAKARLTDEQKERFSKIDLYEYPTGSDTPEFGFYWNGRSLVVKMYFQAVQNVEAPLIAFDTIYASQRFDVRDFTDYVKALPFKQTAVLTRVAVSLKSILDKTEEISNA